MMRYVRIGLVVLVTGAAALAEPATQAQAPNPSAGTSTKSASGFADYRTSVEKKLSDWDRQIDQMRRSIDRASDDRKDTIRNVVTELQAHRDDVDSELRRLPSGDVDAKDPSRARIEQHFAEMSRLASRPQRAE